MLSNHAKKKHGHDEHVLSRTILLFRTFYEVIAANPFVKV